MARATAGLALAWATLGAASCAARFYQPPTGPGTPWPEASQVWRELTTRCRTTNDFVAEVRVDGWADPSRQRFAATLHAAFTRANDIYLEVPGLGRSWVQMAGRAEQAVLLLPRDERVLRAGTREIVDGLTGLRWDAVDLLDTLTGCVTDSAAEVAGTSYGEQAELDLGDGARAWVRRRDGAWQLVAATHDGLLIEYRKYSFGNPSEVRVSASASSVRPLVLSFFVSQVQTNTGPDPSIFVLRVPESFVPITLDELRSARPLGDRKGDR